MRPFGMLLLAAVACADDPVSPCPRGTEGCMCDEGDRCDDTLVCDRGTCVLGADCGRRLSEGERCNDGDPCTHTDVCVGTDCVGTPYSCVDGIACTDDICDGLGGCGTSISSGFCLIDDECYADGSAGDVDCLVCDVAVSQTTWAPDDGAGCDDDDPCTHSDSCSGASCTGTSYGCDDGNHCTVDVCNGDGTCSFVEVPQSCVINAVCYPAGMTEPNNPCARCDPFESDTTWTALPDETGCDDGDPCTANDTCTAGDCGGAPYVCDDEHDCTIDTCNGDGTCTFRVENDACLIEEICYDDGEALPGELCTVCDAIASQDSWTELGDGDPCDDGLPCTEDDVCDASGACAGTPYVCDDDNDCTTDVCDGLGGCNTVELTGPLCDDEDPCTRDDECDDGVCDGIDYSCDDSIDCTTDVCDGEGNCDNPVTAGSCYIDEVCYADTDPNPANECEWCEADTPDAWSDNDGASCSDGDGCTDDDTCSGGVCSGTPLIVDPYEDNDDIASAHYLGSVDDDDDFPDPDTVQATLYPTDDVDVFRFRDNDSLGFMGPRAELSNIAAGSNYQLCLYFECLSSGSSPDVSCTTGFSSMLGGLEGCCSNNAGSASETVELAPDCGNGLAGDDSGYVYVRVNYAGGAWNCTSEYTLEWGDN